MYVLQTSSYQNTAELLTQSRNTHKMCDTRQKQPKLKITNLNFFRQQIQILKMVIQTP